MDQSLDVSKLSDTDKKELSQHLQNESQKAAIQQSMLPFTRMDPDTFYQLLPLSSLIVYLS